jgi:glycosyltransferase involved in cell wall biosynthesis
MSLNKKNPLISIIIPCYNSENYIERFILSIIRQKYLNIELIFVDDGSQDGTKKIILKYKKILTDKGIKSIYKYKENGGMGSATNLGLKYVTGKYFAWCDSDNFFHPDYTLKIVEYINENGDFDILRHDGIVVDEKDLKSIESMSFIKGNKYKKNMFNDAIFEINFHFGCAVLNTESFDRVVEGRNIYESREGSNWQLLLPMFYFYESQYIDISLFYFVKRSDSISNKDKDNLEKMLEKFDEHEKILLTTIKTLPIDFFYYEKKIKLKYLKRKFDFAIHFNNIKVAKETYCKIKLTTKLNIISKIKYAYKLNQITSKIYKLIIKSRLYKKCLNNYFMFIKFFKHWFCKAKGKER